MVAAFECRFEEGLSKYDAAIDNAEADVIKAGLGVPPRPMRNNMPADRPTIPNDLSGLGVTELSQLLGELTQWHSYAIGQKIIASNQRDAAAEKKAFAWRYIRLQKEGTVADKDDSTGTDIRYVDVEAQYRYYDAKYTLLCGIAEALKREIETVSRAVELLKQRIETEGRCVAVDKMMQMPRRYTPHDALSTVFRGTNKRR